MIVMALFYSDSKDTELVAKRLDRVLEVIYLSPYKEQS